jgi:hypothetical protein
MTHFNKSGSIFRPAGKGEVIEALPPGNYVLKLDDMIGFFLDKIDDFKLPEKIYGDCAEKTQRILNTFRDRNQNTGVLLVGEKGSGKTLLMRKLSIESNLPVIIINNSFVGDNFNSFLSSITQPAIVLFDEFEKIYKKDKQEHILTLLDGTYQSNKLFIITSNNKWQLDENMKNRPGRIYYMFEYHGLDEDFIREYCNDNLVDKTKINRLVALSKFFSEFNFDMLAAIVEETNRYGEDPGKLLTVLNIRPEYSSDISYDVQLVIGDVIVPQDACDTTQLKLKPFSEGFDSSVYFCWNQETNENAVSMVDRSDTPISYYIEMLESKKLFFGKHQESIPSKDHSYDYRYFKFNPNDIHTTDGVTIVYKNEQGVTAILTRSIDTRRLDVAYSTF